MGRWALTAGMGCLLLALMVRRAVKSTENRE